MGRDRTLRQPWSDVRISFIPEPGGPTLVFEPTLVSRKRLDQDLTFEQNYFLEHSSEGRDAIESLEKAVGAFKQGAQFYVVARSPEDKIPEIYTSQEYIDQVEAERILTYFLETKGLRNVSFQWVPPEFPCSVG
jgi:hypothetical protein